MLIKLIISYNTPMRQLSRPNVGINKDFSLKARIYFSYETSMVESTLLKRENLSKYVIVQ